MARRRSQLAVVAAPAPIDTLRAALTAAAVSKTGVELLPMPQVASQIIALAFDTSSNAAQLSELIQRDPTLAGQLMRVANSAIYRPRTPAISLQQAIAWLGMSEVQNLAVALAIRGQVFKAPGHDTDIEELWRESMAAALWGQGIAKVRNIEPDVAYLCGLLHTVGRAAVLRILSRVEAQERFVCDARTCSVLLDEFENEFAGQVLNDWNLPLRISSAVLNWRTYQSLRYYRADAAVAQAAHALAVATLHPDLMDVKYLGSNPVFTELAFTDETLGELIKRADDVRSFVDAL